MYHRSTTASRRHARLMNTNWLHIYVMAQAGVL